MQEQLYHTAPEDWKFVPATGERGEKWGSGDGSAQGWGRNAVLRVEDRHCKPEGCYICSHLQIKMSFASHTLGCPENQLELHPLKSNQGNRHNDQ